MKAGCKNGQSDSFSLVEMGVAVVGGGSKQISLFPTFLYMCADVLDLDFGFL
jgi:hypothetical protein